MSLRLLDIRFFKTTPPQTAYGGQLPDYGAPNNEIYIHDLSS